MIDVIPIITAMCLGLISGIITGLAPGIPIIMGYLLFLPFVEVSPAPLLVYAVVSNLGSQYFGSQAALYYRIPGESSSYPVLIEAPNFDTPAKIYQAVQVTTWGSFFASVAAGGFLWMTMTLGWLSDLRLPLPIKSLLFLILIGIAVFANGRWLVNLLALVAFSVLAFWEDLASMTQGVLPVYYFNGMLALIIVFATQAIWHPSMSANVSDRIDKVPMRFRPWAKTYAGSTALGMILGLIPQLGATISSYAAYLWCKYRKQDPMTRVAAAETANNSGIIMMWMPLLLFGVPISATEIFFLQYFAQKGLDLTVLREQASINWMLFAILASSAVYLALALATNRVLYRVIADWLKSKWFVASLAVFSLLMFYYINNYTASYVLVHVLVFVPVSWLISRLAVDMLTAVLGLLLMGEILSTWYRVYQIYF